MSCKLQMETRIDPNSPLAKRNAAKEPAVYHSKIWWANGKIRIAQNVPPIPESTYIVLLNKRSSYLIPPEDPKSKQAPPGKFTGVVKDINEHSCLTDPFSKGLLFFAPRPIPPDFQLFLTLEEVLKKASKSTLAESHFQDEPVNILHMDLGSGYLDCWLSPKYNYLPRKWIIAPRGKPEAEVVVDAFAELSPGIFCPTQFTCIVYDTTTCTIILSDIQINQPLPDSLFDPRQRPGSFQINKTEGNIYRIGQTGEPEQVVGRHIEDSTPESPAASATPLDADESRWSFSHFLIAFFGLTAVFLLIRYRRRLLN